MSQTPDETKHRGPLSRFVRFIFAILRNYFAVVGFIVTVIPVLMMVAVSRRAGPEAPMQISDNTSLQLELAGKIAERQPGFEETVLKHFFAGEDSIYLPEIRSALKRAAADQRIAGVDIRFGALRG